MVINIYDYLSTELARLLIILLLVLMSTIIFYEELLYRKSESYVSHDKTSKHQCTRLGSVPNLTSQASSPFCEK